MINNSFKLFTLIVLLFLLLSCGDQDGEEWGETGTIYSIDFEVGLCWKIDGDNGITYELTQMYNEFNEFREEGLRVRFEFVDISDQWELYCSQEEHIIEITRIKKL